MPGGENELDRLLKARAEIDGQLRRHKASVPASTPSLEDETLVGALPTPGGAVATPAPIALTARYEVLGELGRGGMGIVYKARDRETGEVVALKVLQPAIAARPEVVERFKSELRLARKITHKNVCRIHELLRFGDTAVISMEYVEGESLRAFLQRYKSVSVRTGLEWIRQICSALAEAHAQGVIHRDLKPENVLIARDGTAKVMDFGIARSLDTDTLTTGALIGTPAYMSPEQAEGKKADTRSDIYSLGLVMYEMFTGRAALQAETPVALALKQIHETPASPREIEPDLPERISRAIQKCLEKDPKKRFQSAVELEAALSEKPVPEVAPEAPPEEAPLPLYLARWQRSDYVLLGAALLGFVLFFLLFDWTFPYSTVKILPKDQAEQVVKDNLKKLGLDATPTGGELFLDGFSDYRGRVALLGLTAARRSLKRDASYWRFLLAVPNHRGFYLAWVDQDGRPRGFYLGSWLKSLPTTFKECGEFLVQRTSIVQIDDLPHLRPWALRGPAADKGCAVTMIDRSSSVRRQVQVTISQSGSATVSSSLGYGGWDFYPRMPYWRPPWDDASLGLLTVAVAGLFFLRRLRRQPTSWLCLLLALTATTSAFVVFHRSLWSSAWYAIPRGIRFALGGGFESDLEPAVRLILESLLFVILWATGYCVLTAGRYYLKKNDSRRSRTFFDLFNRSTAKAAAALAVARGVLLGLILTGGFVALLALGAWLERIFPDVLGVFWATQGIPADSRVEIVLSVLPMALRAFTASFLEAFVLIWVLMALPASLLRRVVSRPVAIAGLLTILWLAVGYSLVGMSAQPLGGLYLSLALQGAVLSAIYLRWDLLTTMAAIFTVETWLLGYATYQMFRSMDAPVCALPLIVWFAFALAAFALYFRPHLTAAYRRVAAVFE